MYTFAICQYYTTNERPVICVSSTHSCPGGKIGLTRSKLRTGEVEAIRPDSVEQVRRAPRRTERSFATVDYLYRIIDVIGAGPNLDAVLRGVVQLLTESTACHGCFIYFLQDGHLVLRAASNQYSHLEGKVSLSIDQGLTGWVARTRRPAYIRDRALEDPRFVYVPELDEEEFQSLGAVPLLARSGDVVGVITLHARAPHEFTRSDLEFLEHTASLVVGAIENARLYEEVSGRVALLTELSRLAQHVAAAASIDEIASVVVEGSRALLGATCCEICLRNADGSLGLRASSPRRAAGQVADQRSGWSALLSTVSRGAVLSGGLAEAVWGPGVVGVSLFTPLVVAEDTLGGLCALVEHDSEDRRNVLAAIASHAAVAIRRQQLIESLKETNQVKDFFEALTRGDAQREELEAQAARLRCDLAAPQVVLQALPWSAPPRPDGRVRAPARQRVPGWPELSTQLESRLKVELPGSIFDRQERSLRALLRVPSSGPEQVAEVVRRLYREGGGSELGPLAAGLSNVCRGPELLARGFEEAATAVRVGPLLKGTAGVFLYEDLGAYRYVLTAEGAVRDRYQERLVRLVDYERRRGTQLLRTLEVYLERQGNIARTARALYLHPNTLRQRLSRIEQLAQLDLEHEDWLSLAMAIKAVKLHVIRSLSQASQAAVEAIR